MSKNISLVQFARNFWFMVFGRRIPVRRSVQTKEDIPLYFPKVGKRMKSHTFKEKSHQKYEIQKKD